MLMKPIVFAFIISLALVFQSCTEKVALNSNIGRQLVVKTPTPQPLERTMYARRKVQDRIQGLSEKTQIFTINANKDTSIIGQKGTIVTVHGDCLTNELGEKIQGTVQLELIELYSKKDMILSNKPTISDGKLLESNGEIYLNATAGGKKITIDCADGIMVQLASPYIYDMEMWLGALDKNGNINWQKDSLVAPVEQFVEQEWNYDGDNIGDNMKFYPNYETTVNNFFFTTEKFGWINCDRFYQNEEEKADMYVQLRNPFPKEYQTYLYVVFPGINSVLPIYSADGETFALTGLPANMDVKIVCVSATENKLFFTMKETIVKQGLKEMVELQPMAKAEIEKMLENL